ncbi:acyl-CoA dehydrogenase/oxidase C-terminal [Massariosphaeria phaeospora]|uniref:Acyl-coenzyme A oxidase n=1 Tax=Massariosphaeria phaeospora TaxID=100035 RepID=A0A7C8IED3_9PLEO|nr:acyl-CoA dehydrogenase/oxidase C-terminal [Massariosphaeria phaeospora]
MKKAREAASFDTHELTCLIYGGEQTVQQRRVAFERVERALGTRDTSILPRCYGNMNRDEAYDEGLEVGRVTFEDGRHHNHDFFLESTPRGMIANASPFGLVRFLFEPAIQYCGNEEQKAKWLPLSRAGKILGTYCQTELGHGTFVRGLETTATFDQTADEFVIHSPTLSSTKFWPGGLGFSTTHTVVMARLMIGTNDHGPHLFIVQLRSTEDGMPLPGIKLGDVGLKMAYNGTDNGFACFELVRIPRSNMLMGHVTVSRDGAYSAIPGHAVLSYSTMLLGRVRIARITAFQLAQATTIAVRYSTVREQGVGPDSSGPNETRIISYRSQHFRLLTLVAKAYATLFASRKCDADHTKLRVQQESGEHSMLPYMHSLSAGMKAWATSDAADGAEDARKCCGGHGFLMISGLPEIVASITAAATFEGENYVLWQQVGRYLLKCVDALKAGQKLHPDMVYLNDGNGVSASCKAQRTQFLGRGVQLSIYRHRAQRLVFSVHAAVRSSSMAPPDAWNYHMMAIISAARAHIEYIALQAFVTQLENLPASTTPALQLALNRLCSLFALSNLINPRSVDVLSFVEDGHLSSPQLDMIREQVNELLDALLPDAIALTDAWDFTDASLCSALGMADGNVYENIMRWVEQLPINQKAWKENSGVYEPGWTDSVDPILKAKL